MNRRGFIQSVIGVVAALFLPKKAKAEIPAITTIGGVKNGENPYLTDEYKQRLEQSFEKLHPSSCNFRGYHFVGCGNRIFWFKSEREWGWNDLHTHDRIRCFVLYRDELFWLGEHERWEIQYTREGAHPFQFALNEFLK